MMILGVIVASLGGFVPTQMTTPNGFGQPSNADVSGSYRRIGYKIYAQNLGQVNGLSIEGINLIDGETNVTDLLITVPSERTCRIQEAHITIGHILSGIVEERLFQEEVENKYG